MTVYTKILTPSFYDGLALCLRNSEMCNRISYVMAAITLGKPIEVILSLAAQTDANEILSEEAIRDYLYSFVGLAFGAAPDLTADINMAFPSMERTRGRDMFEKARK